MKLMNPTKKGWFESYVLFRTDKLVEDYVEASGLHDREKVIYKWMQPSGLMYGHPVNIPFFDTDQAKKYENSDRTKLILAESFLMSMYATETDRDRLNEQLGKAPDKVIQFYESLFPDMRIRRKNLFGINRTEHKVAEDLISGRLKVKSSFRQNFWSGFFQNSLLFLDVYYFFRYLERNDSINLEELRRDLEGIRFLIVNVIAASAHANLTIEKEERELFNFFLASANLPPDKKTRAREIFLQGAPLNEIKFPKIESWLLKKYILELAALTIWSDKTLEESERSFLKLLSKKLGLDDEELEISILSIESFVVENWDKVHYLQSKENYRIVGERLVKSMQLVMKKNKDSIVKEVRESRELMSLLAKSQKETLTVEEKEKVRTQLIDIVKSIPALVIIALPGSFLTLPILLKILPKGALPSAFGED